MKQLLHLKTMLVTLLTMLVCTGVFAEDKTSTLKFTKACGGTGTADDGATWTITSDGTESSFDSSKGIHYGTSSSQVSYIKLSTSSIPSTINKIIVNASTASGVSATVNVTVGGSDFGSQGQDLTSSAADYTFTGSASGEIVVTVQKPEKAPKALYVKSIVVTYSNEAPSSNLRYDPTSITVTYDKKDNFIAPQLKYTNDYDGIITYASSNPSVATVDASGVVTIHAVGETTITASGAATQNLKESEATFTLTVNDIQGSATGGTGASVFVETFDKADSSGGNDGSFSSASSQVMTNNNVCDNAEWTGAMYKANKCVKVGTGSETWKVTTPEINVEPNIPYTLIFKAAPWANESSTKMKVTITGGSIEGISTGNMTTGKWNDSSATITPNSSSIKINFFVTGGKRFFLDEINVLAPSDSETVDVTIPASGWGTFCYQYPLDLTVEAIPEGLKAYAVSSSSTTNVTLSEINQKLIGGTGIIINGTPETKYTIKVADIGKEYSRSNLLTGTLSPTYIEKGQYFLKNGQFVYSSAGTLPANKAYLKSANAPEAAANLGFVVEEATGIAVMCNVATEEDNKWYDLSGRIVSPTSKGIYIHKGKKYVIK